MPSQTQEVVRAWAPPRARPPGKSGPRTDIQGLRAVAVGLVLLYHLWPDRVPGGFVGVDVFFVISGFLITTHLLVRPPRRLRDLTQFWARRIRRLLPAALTVLGLTALATRLFATEIYWPDTARQIRSAALYVVNWRLAGDAVDYSAADNPATPVQHYWSLSVEEQFYLVWPPLIAVCFMLAIRHRRQPVAVVRGGLVLVVVTSWLYGMWLTNADPARAYFVTPARIWELAVGGLLAAVLVGSPPTREWDRVSALGRTGVVWVGLVAIGWSAISFNGDTAFPGWRALVPVLGTVAVIAAADPRGPAAPGRALAARPVQWLGDASYSVYLWHWPLVILVPEVTGDALGWRQKLTLLAAALVLAGLTKRYVEDRFRFGPKRAPLFRTYLVAAVGMALVVGLANLQLAEVDQRQRVAAQQLAAAERGADSCFGAPALDNSNCLSQADGPIVPSPAQAVGDRYDSAHSLLTSQDCWAQRRSFAPRTCVFGDPNGQVDVALVGNSHAAQWIAAFDELGLRRGWRITTFFAHNCALSETEQDFDSSEQTKGCRDWVRETTDSVEKGPFDLVVVSNRVSKEAAGHTPDQVRNAFATGYETVLRAWQASGLTVVGLLDTPRPGDAVGRVPDCLSAHPDDYLACSGPRSEWEPEDPLQQAVAAVDEKNVKAISLNDQICGRSTCSAVVGGVIVYSDGSHLTTTYAKTLTPYLERQLTKFL